MYYSITFLNRTTIFLLVYVLAKINEQTPWRRMLKRDWTKSSNSMLNGEHHGGGGLMYSFREPTNMHL
jgi:hypothetical protein